MEELSWKEKKEHFFIGLIGTNLFEIVVILSHFPLLVLLRTILLSWSQDALVYNKCFRFFLDFFVFIFPMILLVTELSHHSTLMLVSLVAFEVCAMMFLSVTAPFKDKEDNVSFITAVSRYPGFNLAFDKDDGDKNNVNLKTKNSNYLSSIGVNPTKLPFLTTYRAWVNIASCICILAVDFHAFPRRLAKTELYGTGLMDVGVGFFILSNALTSKEARIGKREKNVLITLHHGHLQYSALTFQLMSTWPIVFLGMIRLVSVKLLGYNEHITEYGKHWNFFFTLAYVKNLSSIIFFFIHSKLSLFISILLISCYQFVLSCSYTNATEILFDNNREGIIMQNKEGLASSIGFLSLYFAGVYLGSFLFKPRTNLYQWLCASIKLFLISIALWCFLYYSENEIQSISRRLANLSYILWLLALSTYLLAAFICIDIIAACCISKNILPFYAIPDKWIIASYARSKEKISYSPPPSPVCLLYAINKNQLFYFLISNLATGFINGTIETLSFSNYFAVAILCFYQFVITSIVWVLNVKDKALKFW